MTACENSCNWDSKPPLCAKPAAVLIRSGCIHEHVWGDLAICAGCWHHVLEWWGQWLCEPCLRASPPHDCRVTFATLPITEGIMT
jgi:hypothetical protein